jgi:paraquat-inducible protein B
MDPSSEGKKTRAFVGLEDPPVIDSGEAGQEFKLRAKELGGVSSGSPVYYRQINVGSVVNYQMLDNGDLELAVFIRSPYAKHVNAATRFWNAGGIDVTLNAEGLQVKTQSLVTILSGGVAFDTMASLVLDPAQRAPAGHTFQLYPSRSASQHKIYTEKRKILMYFDDPVRGLLPGAPIELNGYKVGEVLDISFEYNRDTNEVTIPVLGEVEPQRVKITGDADFNTIINQLVAKGLRARLQSGNLVFGKLLVALDFHADAPPAKVDFSGKYPSLPTIRGQVATILQDAQALVAELRQTGQSINNFLASTAFKESADDLATTLAHLKRIAAQIDEQAAPQAAAILSGAAATLQEAQEMLATNSTTRTEINRLLQELAGAARSIRLLADYLEQHPESLIKGKD